MQDIKERIVAETPRLYKYAAFLTRNADKAEDLVQETMYRAINKCHLWKEGTDLRAWLFTLMHNQHVNEIRKSVRRGLPASFEENHPFLTKQADQEAKLIVRDLVRALSQLSEEHRTAVILIGYHGLSYDKAAELLDIPIGTVRSRLSRGRDTLRHLLER